MHASQLAELGSWVATNAKNLIYGEQPQPMLVSTNYWQSSKLRLQRWVTALKMFEQDFDGDNQGHNPWPALEILIQEILTSEMLTRIWSASVLTHDYYHQTDELSGLAHSVHVSHIEAKNRAIRIMLRGRAHDEKAFDRINKIRRRIERWTDLFLGQLPLIEHSSIFAFDKSRVSDFNREQQESAGPEYNMRQKVLLGSFSKYLADSKTKYSANPELNRKIASGILACFPSDRFDSLGLPKSARMVWLEKSHMDTQVLVDQLVDFENEAEMGTRV